MARGISLRDFRPEDASAVHRWFNSPAATANLLEHRDEFSGEDARRWVERAIEQSQDPRSEDRKWAVEVEGIDEPVGYTALYGLQRQTAPELGAIMGDERVRGRGVGRRSEEHTSELQSHSDLVCRLLLAKKKKKRMATFHQKKQKNKKTS